MAKFQPKCVVECWVNMKTKDCKMVWKGDSATIKNIMSNGYKKHDEKEILFASIEVPKVSQ